MVGKAAKIEIRVRYSETDKMGYCYYGNYAQYFEVARVEALRDLGVSYKELEDRGIGLPVRTYSITYKRPAYYDDLLTVSTLIESTDGPRIFFSYEVHNEAAELICSAKTELVFVDLSTGRPTQVPDDVRALLS